jgi:hypothetical protein
VQQENPQFSVVSSSVSQDAKTKANKLKGSASYRKERRKNDSVFSESERSSQRRYRTIAKASKEFARKYTTEFHNFLRSKGVSDEVIRAAIGLGARPTDAPVVAPVVAPIATPVVVVQSTPVEKPPVDYAELLGLPKDQPRRFPPPDSFHWSQGYR